MIVKPVEGRLVRDPITMSAVSPEGLPAADGDLYWARAAMDGDVTIEPDPAPVASAPSAPARQPAPLNAPAATSSERTN